MTEVSPVTAPTRLTARALIVGERIDTAGLERPDMGRMTRHGSGEESNVSAAGQSHPAAPRHDGGADSAAGWRATR